MARGSHPLFARVWARASVALERGVARHRRELLAGLSGRVIEIGAGNGLSFARYPDGVASIVAVEPEGHLRRLAQQAAERASVPIEVVDGIAEQSRARQRRALCGARFCLPMRQLEWPRVLRLRGEERVVKVGGGVGRSPSDEGSDLACLVEEERDA